jgi:hypothetical protein
MLRRFLRALFLPLYALLGDDEEPLLLDRYRKLPKPPKNPDFPPIDINSRSLHTDTLKLPIPRKSPPPLKPRK